MGVLPCWGEEGSAPPGHGPDARRVFPTGFSRLRLPPLPLPRPGSGPTGPPLHLTQRRIPFLSSGGYHFVVYFLSKGELDMEILFLLVLLGGIVAALILAIQKRF